MIRLLPRTPRGTWLLAGAVWLAGCGALWYWMPDVPRAEWTIPDYAEHCGVGRRPRLVGVDGQKGTATIVGHQLVWGSLPSWAYANQYRGPIRVFDLMTGRELRRYFTQQDSFRNIAESPDGRWLALGAPQPPANGTGITLIDLERDRTIPLPDAVSAKPSQIEPVTFARNRAAAVYSFGRIDNPGLRSWDLEAGRALGETNGAEPPVAIARDGDVLAYVSTANGKRAVEVAEWPTFRSLAEFSIGEEWVTRLSLSSDGKRLAAVLEKPSHSELRNTIERSIHCWDVPSRREILARPNEEAMRLTANGRTLVTYANQPLVMPRRLVAWDLSSSHPRWERILHSGGAWLEEPTPDSFGDQISVWTVHQDVLTDLRLWVVGKGWRWPFREGPLPSTRDLVDAESGKTVARSVPPGRIVECGDGPMTVFSNWDPTLLDDRPPVVEIWDISPRKSLKWLTGIAALLAVPIVMFARRRVRRLGREVAA